MTIHLKNQYNRHLVLLELVPFFHFTKLVNAQATHLFPLLNIYQNVLSQMSLVRLYRATEL